MCGFTGFFGFDGLSVDETKEVAINMNNQLTHRGPDDEGYWLDAEAGIALAHRRLSIIDLTSSGHQPMISSSGRYVIVFNGEIYNHIEIRNKITKLIGIVDWNGHSDTETLIASIDIWGLENTLQQLVGMFAFALWDRNERALYLVRDRMGEKPLYYGWQGNTFLFGSELKALKSHPKFCAEIDRQAITLLLRHNYIPAPYTIYQGIFKLFPGNFLSIKSNNKSINLKPKPYWSFTDIVTSENTNTWSGTDEEAVIQLDTLLRNSIGKQMIADVPLGAFLSGGIDSTCIVALMQTQSSQPIKTFTIGFNENEYNEATNAKKVANYLGTDHTELYVTPKETRDVIPRLSTLYDEPFSDSSQIPIFLLSQLTRKYVKVSLTGDAGDELFCGYNRYFRNYSIWNKLKLIPKPLRHLGSKMLLTFSPEVLYKLSNWLPISLSYSNLIEKTNKLANILSLNTLDDLYLCLFSHWSNPAEIVFMDSEHPTLLNSPQIGLASLDIIQKMMALDTLTYLPDDILVKVDRAAMGVSLETRIPFLDHRVVEFIWGLPLSLKKRNNRSKWILREVLNRYIPKELVERPKMGFGVPIDSWLRGPLRDWAESLLDEARLRQEGFFNPDPIRKNWQEHLSGKRNWQYHLWDVLMFQDWLEQSKT